MSYSPLRSICTLTLPSITFVKKHLQTTTPLNNYTTNTAIFMSDTLTRRFCLCSRKNIMASSSLESLWRCGEVIKSWWGHFPTSSSILTASSPAKHLSCQSVKSGLFASGHGLWRDECKGGRCSALLDWERVGERKNR